MHSTMLFPPKQLSDNLIGDVVQRSGDRRYGHAVPADYMDRSTSYGMVTRSYHKQSTKTSTVQLSSEPTLRTCNDFVSSTGHVNERLKPNTHYATTSDEGIRVVSSNRRRSGVKRAEISRQRNITTVLHRMVPEHKATPELIEALIRNDARQRQRRREIQQRYRQKFDNLAESLEHEVKKIQEQIRLRELEHERLVVRTPTSVTPWIVVSEYYRLFRNGFKVPQTPQPIITSPGTIYERNNAQMAFLHKVMAPDVSVNSGIGIEAIVQEWLAVPYVNDDITIRLLQLENDEDDAMLATIQSHIIITEDMLRCEFPYFADITIEDQKSALVNKLVGKKLSILSKVRFEWDSSSGRVLGMHYTADLVTPFLKLLGNLQDTARVLDKSLLSIANSS